MLFIPAGNEPYTGIDRTNQMGKTNYWTAIDIKYDNTRYDQSRIINTRVFSV
jgi:hypothetical protein